MTDLQFELPLFPLRSVLFPGTPLALHIFEDRYKEMMRLCLERRSPFGVVLIRAGQEAHGPLAEPHDIGCTARVAEVQELSGGRMNIVAFGQERFQIQSLLRDRAYLVAVATAYPLVEGDPASAAETGHRLRPWVTRYIEALGRVSQTDVETDVLPEEPTELAYMAAYLLQLPAAEKQELLAAERVDALLDGMLELYRREVELVTSTGSRGADPRPGLFSRN